MILVRNTDAEDTVKTKLILPDYIAIISAQLIIMQSPT